jgi:hypothetical protein
VVNIFRNFERDLADARFQLSVQVNMNYTTIQMIQQLITYIILAIACVYVIHRAYKSLKKKEACGKCELMKAAKTPKKATS